MVLNKEDVTYSN